MIKQTALPLALLLSANLVAAHDMFFVMDDHYVRPETPVTVALYNGTFDKSENAIARDRMIDVSVVGGAGDTVHPQTGQWREDGPVTLLDFETAGAGTYVVGLSTAANMIELSAEDFNDYLTHDGVLDVLEQRKKQGTIDQPANERYSKHVKTILQVGDDATESYVTRLGYPIEIVPLSNPADLEEGATLEVLVLADGEPVADQLVYASYAGFHSHGDDGAHREATSVRTDGSGQAKIEISRPGRWYVRLIRMVESSQEGVDYESNWATLTFEVK